MVRGLVDIPEDEFDVPKIPDARVCPRVHELRAIEVHSDDMGAGGRGDEREASLSRPDVQDASPAKVFVPELIEEHRAEGVGLLRRLPPRQRAAYAHDVRHDVPAVSQGTRGIRGHRCRTANATRLYSSARW